MSATAWRSLSREPERKGPKPGSTQTALRFSNQTLVLGAFLNSITQGHVSVSLITCVCTLKMHVFPFMCVYEKTVVWTCKVEDRGAPQALGIVSKSLCCSIVIMKCVCCLSVYIVCFMAQTDKERTLCLSWPSSNNTMLLPQHNNSTTIKEQSSLL